MSRPALSASRSIDILDLLGTTSDGAFTMSQIAAAIDVNVTSCHAILNELTERGYVTRHPILKTYTLGPALIALGNAAQQDQAAVARARLAAEALSREHAVPVSLTRLIGSEVLVLFALPAASGLGVAVRPGRRVPLVPPVGAPYLAWANGDEIGEWIARRKGNVDEAMMARWRDKLVRVKERGYQVLLRSSTSGYFPKLMSEFADGQGKRAYKERVKEMIETIDESHVQLDTIEPGEFYDVTLIAAPIFDNQGKAIYNLCIGDLPERISGETIQLYAESLMRHCIQIMREGRMA